MKAIWFCKAVVFGILFSCNLNAQDNAGVYLKQLGDQYYNAEQYKIAIQYFQEAADLNPVDAILYFNLAECYRKSFQYQEAEMYYLKAYTLAQTEFPQALYYYALMLKLNGQYAASIEHFHTFITQHQEDQHLKEFIEQADIEAQGSAMAKDRAPSLESVSYALMPAMINTVCNDYAPVLLDSASLVITSGRINSNRKGIDERYGEAFSDNYYFEKKNGVWVDKTRQVFAVTNTSYNDGSGCFNGKGDKYYYTSCGKGGAHCKIFVSVYKDRRWSEPYALNDHINFNRYDAKQPSVSKGGDTLVFVSDRPGGYGKHDLWMSINAGDEQWGPPVNLGRGVNTNQNEISPVLTIYPNILFFASEGHKGYGGFDLYMAKRMSTGDTLILNLDTPFSSNGDDCFATLGENVFLWSSNRPGAIGGFDIYAHSIPSVISFISRITIKNRSAKREVTLASRTAKPDRLNLIASHQEEKITYEDLSYERKKIVDRMVENRTHNKMEDKQAYQHIQEDEYQVLLKISEQRFQEYVWQLRMDNKFLMRIQIPSSSTNPEHLIEGNLIDSVQNTALPSYKILLTDTVGEVLKITSTNTDGKFRFTGVPADKILLIRLEKTSADAVKPKIININMVNVSVNDAMYGDNIYFDFDHYVIRPEAGKVLDGIADYLIQHPHVQVEIFAYADDRGSNAYNLRLTQKRGQAVVDYLANQGVDETGLAIIPKGRQTLTTTFVTEGERQYNRRVEFYMNGLTDALTSVSRTYILKENFTWEQLSALTDVSIDQLKELNGTNAETLKAFQPVRIPGDIQTFPKEIFFEP